MIKISFIGDISLNDKYIELPRLGEDPFCEISRELEDSDLVIGNLEGFHESEKGENLLKSPRLKANQESLSLLKKIKIDIVSLANNHAYDNLYDGFEKTINFLNNSSIEYLGAYKKEYEGDRYLIRRIKNKKIAILNYVHELTNPSLPEDVELLLNIYEKNNILETIKKLNNKFDLTVLILHWGMDNSYFPEPWQRKDAQDFIKAGVDLIVGHHSHTIQGYEKIENKYIFYSLGNFCFAPFIWDGEIYDIDHKRHFESFILKIILKEKNVYDVDFIPILNDGLLIKLGSNKFIKKIERISKLIPPMTFIWPLYKIYLNLFYKIYFYFFGNNRNPIERLKKIDLRRIKKFFQLIKISVS